MSHESHCDLIASIGFVILRSIVAEVNSARFFSVLANETTDVAGHEQLTVVIRYVHSGDIREQFISFLQIEDLTGAGLANNILLVLHESGFNTNITNS